MASEIRVNTINNSSGLGTITISDTGHVFSGITTIGSVTIDGGTVTGNLTGNVTGIVTSTGISTFSDTVNVGAGKSIRLYGASSGYSEIVAAAGSASTTFTLPANGGSASQYLQTNGAGVLSWQTVANTTLQRGTAQSTASGSAVTFDLSGVTGNIRLIYVMFDDVSTTGSAVNDTPIVQIGDAGSVDTTGYNAMWMYSNSGSTGTTEVTQGFPIINGTSDYLNSGTMVLTNFNGNKWNATSLVHGRMTSANDALGFGAGSITIGGALDTIRVTTIGSNFDGGNVNLMWEVEA